VVVIWLPTILIFSSVDTWQLVINTMTSVLAFLLIALLQNSERRYDEALHRKIDALAAGVARPDGGRDGSGQRRHRPPTPRRRGAARRRRPRGSALAGNSYKLLVGLCKVHGGSEAVRGYRSG
jgi:hypothetical protein